MNIDSIQNGVVIDHIHAGFGMKLYTLLKLESLDAQVAIIMNASSNKMGRKDIIKIDAQIPIDLDIIGYVDPGATINVIRNGVRVEKYEASLPLVLTNVIKCKNPRCISSCEQELPHKFKLTDEENRVYRCIYCETKSS